MCLEKCKSQNLSKHRRTEALRSNSLGLFAQHWIARRRPLHAPLRFSPLHLLFPTPLYSVNMKVSLLQSEGRNNGLRLRKSNGSKCLGSCCFLATNHVEKLLHPILVPLLNQPAGWPLRKPRVAFVGVYHSDASDHLPLVIDLEF